VKIYAHCIDGRRCQQGIAGTLGVDEDGTDEQG
jgi:hypothetical protein